MSDDMLPQGLQLTKTAWSQRLETAEKSARLRREVPFVANTQFLDFKFQKPQGSIANMDVDFKIILRKGASSSSKARRTGGRRKRVSSPYYYCYHNHNHYYKVGSPPARRRRLPGQRERGPVRVV